MKVSDLVAWSLETVSMLTLSVEDATLLLQVLASCDIPVLPK